MQFEYFWMFNSYKLYLPNILLMNVDLAKQSQISEADQRSSADRAQWTGSASDLLQVGINVGGNAMAAWTRSGWPKSPRALAGRLRRAQTPLRALGIEIVFGREGRLGTRTIRITAMGENRTHDTVSTVSRVSDHGDRAGLNHPPPGLEQAL